MVCRSTNNKIICLLYKSFQCLTTELFFLGNSKEKRVTFNNKKTRVLFTQRQILVRLPNIN
jgi:hypothetical protein